MSIEIPIAAKYLPTNQNQNHNHNHNGKIQDDDEYFHSLLIIDRDDKKDRLEKVIGNIWLYRINAFTVLILGVGLLFFHKTIQSILKVDVIVVFGVVVIMSIYGCVVCWFYSPWIQLPISFPYHFSNYLNVRY